MADGYNLKLPLKVNSVDGPYILTKKYNENVKQNVKMIILTEKGEKISNYDFGCGLKAFLFEMIDDELADEIDEEIRSQLIAYAPYIVVKNIEVSSNLDMHSLSVLLEYSIPQTNATEKDFFEVTS